MIASLFFYAWGETFYVAIMFASIILNYVLAIRIERSGDGLKRKVFLFLAVGANLLILAWFKYANFFVENINIFLQILNIQVISVEQVHLPIGISFFTFQALSYVIDVYRKKVAVQKKFINIALYISLFPQLIAGPIVRYYDIAKEIKNRSIRIDNFAYGVKRFIIGMGKKMLIANQMGELTDQIMSIPAGELTFLLSWLGAASYTLQIYFDFSGYSDMAIGLGKMFGFTFLENFNYPYISRSIREFWRRWHISLSTWFRDYLYVPLGGSHVPLLRTYFNLWIVFLLCGLWHGASWNFVIWGMIHGFFLVIERIGLERFLKRLWLPLRHVYALLVVMTAWIFFRIEDFSQALHYIKTMAGFAPGREASQYLSIYFTQDKQLVFIFGIIGSMPLKKLAAVIYDKVSFLKYSKQSSILQFSEAGAEVIGVFLLLGIFFLSIMLVAAGTYNPFIYFRF